MRLLYLLVLPFVLAHCNDNTTMTRTTTRSTTRTTTRSTTRSITRSSKLKPTQKPKVKPKLKPKNTGTIPIISGKGATLTYFTYSVFQCTTEVPEYGMAVNPLLLGFTKDDWINRFSNVEANKIPWCGKRMRVTVNGMSFTGVIIDTCDPVGNPFPDPVTGEIIGGKCGYSDVIDLYGETGRSFLQNAVGDDFYQGNVEWELLN